MDLERFSDTIGYRFRNTDLLLRALTHRSFSAAHNERLEFLGDSVVNCAVAVAVYRKFPDLPEGDLHRLRASLVSDASLASIASRHDLGSYLQLGIGEVKTGGASRASTLAAALEAVVGAAFLDGGFEAADSVVQTLLGAALSNIDPLKTAKDPKTFLQEYLAKRGIALPQYSLLGTTGQAHKLAFQVACEIPSLGVRCVAEGPTRRSAEQEAARAAYESVAPPPAPPQRRGGE
jgi:ribonuclease-3